MGSFFTVSAQKPAKPARPITARARRPHPGRNLGLGWQSSRVRLGCELAHLISAVDPSSDGRARVSLGIKPDVARLRAETLSHSSWPSLSLSSPHSSLFTLSTAAPSDELRRRERAASPGAIAGPLAGVRAPQRVSAPPLSGLATAPLWPVPVSSSPSASPFFSPRAGVDDGEVSHPFPLFPFRFLWFFFSDFIRLGD